MNKQLAKKGTTLNKNMTNTESLNVTDIKVNNRITAEYAKIGSMGVAQLYANCDVLTLPTVIPDTYYEGSIYFTHDDQTNDNNLHIYDGHNWIHIDLN